MKPPTPATQPRASARNPDRIQVRVRGPNPHDPDDGPTIITDGLRGLAIGFDAEGGLQVVADCADLDLWERNRLAEELTEAAERMRGGMLGRALH